MFTSSRDWEARCPAVPLVLLTLATVLVVALVSASGDASAVDWTAAINHSEDMQLEVQGVAVDGDQVFLLAKGRPSTPFSLLHRWYDGQSWQDWELVVFQASDVWYGEADICADAGRAHMAWIDRRGTDEYHLYYTWFENGTWGNQTKLDIEEPSWDVWPYEPSIVAKGDEVHIAWRETPDGPDRIVYMRYNGTEWGPQHIVQESSAGVVWEPDIALDGDTVHIVWKSMPVIGADYDIMHRSFDGVTWSSTVMVNIDSADEDQDGPEVVAGDGRAHVVWYEGSAGDRDIKYRQLDGTTWRPIVDLGPAGGLGNQSEPHIAIEGPWLFVAWQDDRDGDERVHLRWFNGTEWQPVEEVTSDAVDRSLRPRIAVEGGDVHLAWNAILDGLPHPYYRTGSLDSTPPSATIEPLTDLWLDPGGVDLNWSADDDLGLDRVELLYRHSKDGTTWSDWTVLGTSDLPLTTRASGTWVLVPADGDGFYGFQARAFDIAGHEEALASSAEASGALDTTPPTGSIVINGGDGLTATAVVTLTLSWQDHMSDQFASVPEVSVYQVRLSNDGLWDTEAWEDPMATRSWMLLAGDGQRTVYFQVMDIAGLLSPVYFDSITLDTSPPTGGVVIDGGSSWTASTAVTLTLVYQDTVSGVAQVRLGNDGVWDDEPWLDAVYMMSWTLPAGDGVKTVHYQVRDVAGLVSTTYTDDIVLDTEAPTGSISINDGENVTGNRRVTLYLEYADTGVGVESVRVGTDGTWDSEYWNTPYPTMSFDLDYASGNQTVYLQVRDVAGHLSGTYSDDILLDMDAPVCSIEIEGGAMYVGSVHVTLYLAYSDATSWVTDIRLSNDGYWDDEPWEEPSETRSWELAGGVGTQRVYLQVRDAAGYGSALQYDQVSIDVTRPEVVTSDPEDGTKRVGTDAAVTISFTEAMDILSVESSFELRTGGRAVLGSFQWSGGDTVMTFIPLKPLERGRTYRVVLTYGAEDATGNGIVSELDTSFDTVSPPTEVSATGPLALWLMVLVVIAMVLALIYPRGRR